MRKRIGNALWGILIIAVGLVFLGNALEWWNISIFFKGWWTLFIIVPCLISMLQTGINAGNVLGIAAGILLLLSANDIITSKAIWPLLIIALGVVVLFPAILSKRPPAGLADLPVGDKVYNAVFTGTTVRADGEVFEGCTLNTTFGGIDMDLRKAVIQHDVIIKASCIFGGVDIILPDNVNSQVGGTHVLGGAYNDHRDSADPDAPLVYIDATCVFGGLSVK